MENKISDSVKYAYIDAKDILLDHCSTDRQAEKIKDMSQFQLAESLFCNLETGWIPKEEMTPDLYQWMNLKLEEGK